MNGIPPRWCRLHSTVVVLDFMLGRAYRACGICDGSDVPTPLVCGEALLHQPIDDGSIPMLMSPTPTQDARSPHTNIVYDVDSEGESDSSRETTDDEAIPRLTSGEIAEL